MKTQFKRWTLPGSYMGAEWPEHFVFIKQNRDSDCLTRSNFRSGMKRLEALPPFTPPDSEGAEEEISSRFAVREFHWACGWVEWIAIHETDCAALEAADKMADALEDYPILDEQDLSGLEEEEAAQVWKDCYSLKSRLDYVRKHRSQFDFQSLADLIGCVRGKYFAGYASELLH